MKATITRPDGTRIEAEGTSEEIAKLAPPPATAVCVCYQLNFAAHWCPAHGYVWRTSPWPGVVYGFPHNAAAACVPNMGQVWVGEIRCDGVGWHQGNVNPRLAAACAGAVPPAVWRA